MIDYFGDKIIKIKMEDIIKYIDQNPKKIAYQKKLFRTIGWQKSFNKDKIEESTSVWDDIYDWGDSNMVEIKTETEKSTESEAQPEKSSTWVLH